MKKVVKVLIALLILIAAAAGVVVYYYGDNISALISGMNSSSEDLAVKMNENREKLKTQVEKYTSVQVADMSAEDEEKLLSGEISLEDVAEKYNLPVDYMRDDDVTGISYKSTAPVAVSKNDNTNEIDAVVGESVSRMYALKAKYVNKLGELERAVFKEYSSLPKEKQNDDAKYKIVLNNLNYVSELEKKCDDEVSNVLASLQTELEKLEGDTEIIGILQKAYQDEKEVKKAYYMSLYNKN
ncbi:MAG: hypothetical protein AAGU76_07560 [Sedimentibacter sp.]|uniref:hypothetical protein n=1 Tax=Sedimentibacter sp. TaxID=1960295 RepID=UPI003158C2A2